MSAMSRNRDDGLSIAVWENSPWRSFIRFRDPVDTADGQAETAPLSRPIQDISQARHQESDDVREIFGRALDLARNKKSFASAASVTSTRKELVMRSEARMMAEDNRSWGVGARSKWGNRADESSDDLEDVEGDDDDEKDGDNAPQAEQVASACRPTESSPGPLSRNSSVRTLPPPSPHRRRGTATGSSGAEDADGSGATDWAASPLSPSSSRANTRLSLMATGSVELHQQTSLAMRTSPHGAPSDGSSTSPLGDTAAGSPGFGASGTSVARGRASKAVGAKLLHIQAAHGPVRQSLEAHASRKPLSPNAPPPPRRSSSFDEPRPGGARLAAASGVITGAASVPANDPTLAQLFRDRRSTTATGTSGGAAHGSTGIPHRGSGGGNSSVGSGAEQHQYQHQLHQQQLLGDLATQRSTLGGRSRRTTLLAGEQDLRPSGSEGSAGRGPPTPLLPSPSGRLPDPHGGRMHAAARPSKMATPPAAAAAGPAGDQRFSRASGSYSFNQLQLHQSLDARKHAPVSSVLSADFGRYGATLLESSGSLPSEGRGIMGRLKGFFSQQ